MKKKTPELMFCPSCSAVEVLPFSNFLVIGPATMNNQIEQKHFTKKLILNFDGSLVMFSDMRLALEKLKAATCINTIFLKDLNSTSNQV